MRGKFVICKLYGKRVGRKIITPPIADILLLVHILSVKIPTRSRKSNNLHINIAINHYFLHCVVNDVFKLTTVSQIHILNRTKSYIDVAQILQIMTVHLAKTRATQTKELTITQRVLVKLIKT